MAVQTSPKKRRILERKRRAEEATWASRSGPVVVKKMPDHHAESQ